MAKSGLVTLGVALALAGCATPTESAFSVLPGVGKDQAAFQQDMAVCQQHAVAHTGYNAPPPPAAAGSATGSPGGPANAAQAGGAPPFDVTGYLQCMASRGDTVQAQPDVYAAGIDPELYPYPDGYPYPYGYDYPYPFYDGGLAVGFGFGSGRFYHRRFGPAGWGHGGWGHGGWGHGGWGHGGWGHGGGGHGGGHH